MSTYYICHKGSALAAGSGRTQIGADNENQTGLSKALQYIYCVGIGQDTRNTAAGVIKLQWKVSGGAFADLGATGALKYTTATDLTNDNAVASSEALVTVTGMTWQDGWEVEDGIAPSIDLASDYYSELQFAFDPADATAGATYEFQLYNSTASAVVSADPAGSGGLLTITIASADPVMAKKNGVALSAIAKFNGVAKASIHKVNGNIHLA